MLELRRRHFLAFAIFTGAIATFYFGPDILSFDGDIRTLWLAVAQIVGTFLACIACFVAARHGEPGDRAAWRTFGTASALYLFGNLFYVYCGLAGYEPGFPTAPEAAYFVMGLFFAVGMAQYGNLSGKITRLHLYNFILVYCAIAVACRFLLHDHIIASVLGPLGTIVAFLYPALWFSVAAFGSISLCLYRQGERGLPFALLLAAVFCESIADLRYAQLLLDGSYRLGGLTQLLWVTSAGLIIWAALEHRALTRRQDIPRAAPESDDDHIVAQAVLPGAAIAIFMLSGSVSGAFGREGFFIAFSAVLGIVFASAAALREHWIINTLQTLRRTSERGRLEVAEGRRRLMTLLEAMSDGVVVVDDTWHITFFNDQAADILAGAGHLHIGTDFWRVFPIGEATEFADRLRSVAVSKSSFESEEYHEMGNRWLSIGAYSTPDGIALFFRDVSESRRTREEINRMALQDALTGLANRPSFQRSLELALASERDVAMLLIDLDHFKEVNDTLGHLVGDAVLLAVAERLRACLPEAKAIARLGGDEFAVVIPGDCSRAAIGAICDRIIASIGAPLSAEGQQLRIGCSIGIATAFGGADQRQMFADADIALYEVKYEARGQYKFFEPAMAERLVERKALRDDLATALENNQLELFYQPLVDLATDRICSFEALLRWRHPVRGMIAPDIFIPVAEETGLIVPIGDWVIRTACLEACSWPDDLSVAVNLSTRQFADASLPERIDAVLRETGFPAARLELEITESAFLDDSGSNLRTLARLRDMGLRIALDDFGTGYSSLGYLQKFRFSKLKIDRAFVADIVTGDESQVIVNAIIGLGKALGIRVTAEGVETRQQYDWLKQGCHEAQGYLISRPVPNTEIPALLLRDMAVESGSGEPAAQQRRA
jgi:diguanylate cyclase (GGDEF)-like protein